MHLILITLCALILVSLISLRLSRKALQNREKRIVSLALEQAVRQFNGASSKEEFKVRESLLPELFNLGLVKSVSLYCPANDLQQWQPLYRRGPQRQQKIAYHFANRQLQRKILGFIPRIEGFIYQRPLKFQCLLILQQDFSLAEKWISSVKSWLVGYVALLALILAGIGYLLLSRLITPLEETVKIARRIANGEEQLRFAKQETAELNTLVGAINAMTEKLVSQQSEIVQREKLAGVGRLAAGLAHEIGNPLAAVIGYQEIVKKITSEDKEVSQYLEKISQELKRIEKLIRELLEYSRPIKEDSFVAELSTVVNDVLKNLEARDLLQNIELENNLSAGLTISVNSEQLRQLLLNILQNAAQAIEGQGKIEISAKRLEKKWLKLMIKDSGCGIAKEDLGKIFDPFFTSKDPGKGTGLGLFLAVNVVKAYGGSIEVESEPGQGTTFEILLPC